MCGVCGIAAHDPNRVPLEPGRLRAMTDEAITNRLKAYVVTNGEPDEAALRSICRERLPSYMMPHEFEFLAELPRSSTGKVDRRALVG